MTTDLAVMCLHCGGDPAAHQLRCLAPSGLLARDDEREVWFLDGRRIKDGDEIDLGLADSRWLRGRFLSHDLLPYLRINLATAVGHYEVMVEIPLFGVVRRPRPSLPRIRPGCATAMPHVACAGPS